MIPVTTSAPCPVCGVRHAACGPVADVRPVDIPRTETKTMGPTRLYDVTVNGYQTRMRLNDADAKEWNATPVEEAPADPADDPADNPDGADAADAPQRRARKTVPNRARTPGDNK